jgi:hypothetical protein
VRLGQRQAFVGARVEITSQGHGADRAAGIDRRRLLAAGFAAGAGVGAGASQAASPRPDFTGVWSNATYTDLQRPKELKASVLTAAEAEAWEKPRRALNGMPPSKDGDVGQAESEFNDRGAGLLRIKGEIRAALIVQPLDGQIPFQAWVREKLELGKKPGERTPPPVDNPEDRPTDERCLISASAVPMIPGPDTNIYEFVQTADALAIVSEKYHDTRVIRFTEADPHPEPSWLGHSVGRWAGTALIVETVGFGPAFVRRTPPVSGRTRILETFTHDGSGGILYSFTVEDHTIYTQVWRAEMVFQPAPGRLFEYACHEGNYGLPDILNAARHMEAAKTGATP